MKFNTKLTSGGARATEAWQVQNDVSRVQSPIPQVLTYPMTLA